MLKKKANPSSRINNKSTSFFILGCVLFSLSACAAQPKPLSHYESMRCDDIAAEIEKLNTQRATAQSNEEVNRAVGTGTSVAVQGASLAGVPYIGGIFSIGKTLINHTKQTRVKSTDAVQENIYTLENLAYEKGCYVL